MATQPPITSFFGSRKRRAADALDRDAKLLKGDPTLLKLSKLDTSTEVSTKTSMQDVPKKPVEQTTPRKGGCDIRSFITSKSPYRPECRSETPIKFFRTDGPSREKEVTPSKPTSSNLNLENTVKKSITFENDAKDSKEPEMVDTDDIIQAANALVEKMKNKQKTLTNSKPKPEKEMMTPGQLKKKLARSAKLAKLQSSLNKLGQQASELMKLEKKKKEIDEPKMKKFDTIEFDVPRSPHKGALPSPIKSPMKPAYERFAHLTHRTLPTAPLPLPFGFQKLLDLFTSTDTVCSMMMNRGEIITFKKLKPAVQELTRNTLTERHLAQMAAVLPTAFDFRQEKLRNFGSTSKVDRYELVVEPKIDESFLIRPLPGATNLIRAAECKKMTPKMLQQRREAFQRVLLDRTIDKHEQFLSELDPPLSVVRSQLTRWHPNFLLDLVPDIPPITLPEPPNQSHAPSTAKEVLDFVSERAKTLLSANERMRNALEAVSCEKTETPTIDADVKAKIDSKIASHDPLKGISKSLLERIRAKQAAKALEAMKTNPADEKELMLLSQLPEIARIVRTLFVDEQKSVLPWESVIEKIIISAKRTRSKADVSTVLRRLLDEMPDWVSVFIIRNVEYLKLNRAAPFAPILKKLEGLVDEKRKLLS